MGQALTKALLSGSTNGKGILVTGTTSGTAATLHTAVSGTSSMDEVWLYAMNTYQSSIKITIEWGAATTSDQIEVTIPPESGLFLIAPGLLLQNSLVIKAFASVGNVVTIFGFVNKIV